MSILAPRLAGARLLDLCAGSGALGLEALSRGAAHVTFVERNPRVEGVLRDNVEALGMGERCRVIRGDALRVLATADPEKFDIVLADPPWADDLATDLVAQFRKRPVGQLLAVEHAAALALSGGETRRYGNTAITFFSIS